MAAENTVSSPVLVQGLYPEVFEDKIRGKRRPPVIPSLPPLHTAPRRFVRNAADPNHPRVLYLLSYVSVRLSACHSCL